VQAPERRRVAVVGVGAVGGAIGGWLDAARRHELTLCTRTRFDRLEVETPTGRLSSDARVVTDPKEVGPVDWILLATKAYDTEGAEPWLRALGGTETVLAVLQNGVEHEERARPLAGGMPIVPVIVACSAERTAPGRVRTRGSARLTVPATVHGRSFRELFEGSAVAVEHADDFTTALWRKLCVNVAGVVTALTGEPLGVIRRPEIASLARGLVLETVRVARAEGARLEDDFADTLVAELCAGRPDATPSILQDLKAGRPLEHDARNGAVVRFGARHGIPTPLNESTCERLRGRSGAHGAR
jgi:2-dehydropantoate 2-reductase